MSDLDIFAPVPRVVTLNDGTTIDILPLRLGQMPAFIKASNLIAGSLFVADYFTILEQQPQAAIDMICAAGFNRDLVGKLWQDETVALLSAIYEVNGDFFIQRLRPAMTKAAAGARAAIEMMATAAMPPSLPTSDSADATSGPASI